jgi:hypothetical protein
MKSIGRGFVLGACLIYLAGLTALGTTITWTNTSGGTPGSNYVVLTSTNVALPLVNWTPVATNAYDGNGRFRFTNSVNFTKPLQVYRVKTP